jgi:3-hydroxy-9,10-secoandrosta-1,3,5(10)-triene-9,17-dione monooxygenase
MSTLGHTKPHTLARPDSQELVDRANGLRARLFDDAANVDKNRTLPDSTFEAMRDADLLRLLVPTRFGGLGADMRTYLEVTMALGRGCGSSAWVAGVLNAGNWIAASYPEQAQEEVWGANPLATTASILAPTSEARNVAGGVVLNGKWGYTSGVNHCDWVSLCYPGISPYDQGMQLALAPVSELSVEDTWHVSGMRGTGSNTVIAQDLFIPTHRLRPVRPLFQGENVTTTAESNQRVSLAGMLPLSLIGAQLGQAQAALDLVVELAPKRRITTTTYTSQAESVGFQVDVADAASTIDAATTMGRQAAQTLDEYAAKGAFPNETLRTRLRNNMSWAAMHSFRAVDQLMTAHGTSGFAEFSPLQRIWRDAGIASRHAAFNTRIAQELYGKSLLNQNPSDISFLV